MISDYGVIPNYIHNYCKYAVYQLILVTDSSSYFVSGHLVLFYSYFAPGLKAHVVKT